MGPELSGGLAILALLVLLGFGVPIVWAMSLVAAAGMWMGVGWTFAFATFQTLPMATVANYSLVVIPMFLLMGGFCHRAAIIDGLYDAAHRLTSRTRGNLLVATVLASAGFAAASGSSLAASSVFTRIALPQMLKFGYSPGVAAGCIAAAGTLAAIIPPSIAMVIIASLTNQSAGTLLIAGIVPGLLTAGVYVVGIKLFLLRFPRWAPDADERFTWRQKLAGLRSLWSILLLGGFIMGGIYSGWFSPSAAGAVGAFGALAIGVAMRRLGPGAIWSCLVESAHSTIRLFAIIVAGLLFSRYLVISGFIGAINGGMKELGVGPVELIAFMIVLYLVLGMFVDSLSLLVITLPTFYPIATGMGLDPVWFSIIAVKLVEIAAITPPVGLNLFAVLGATDQVKSSQLFRGVMPFVAMEIVTLGLLLAFPALTTWLPGRM
ncbi:MAG: TRAP transporter large permease [Albimonas sp.]|uniref:TRAP transporter large permease n=1 Tax=Albimonas sp. TaxID=1872425 RepID=UPI004056A38F|tara:strand:- start:1525 stop:2826 length:1302 start_codon:yes stop_codon:yes gene_type:complete